MMKVGDQVVCLSGKWEASHPDYNKFIWQIPVEKCIYTIRDFINHPHNELGVLLEELVNGIAYDTELKREVELSFCISGFKPVKKTSIDTFTEMLNEVKAPELIEA